MQVMEVLVTIIALLVSWASVTRFRIPWMCWPPCRMPLAAEISTESTWVNSQSSWWHHTTTGLTTPQSFCGSMWWLPMQALHWEKCCHISYRSSGAASNWLETTDVPDVLLPVAGAAECKANCRLLMVFSPLPRHCDKRHLSPQYSLACGKDGLSHPHCGCVLTLGIHQQWGPVRLADTGSVGDVDNGE